MNELTKEELETILNGNIELYPHTYQELRNKIQSMIENYCEHEKVVPNYGCKTQCDKCGRIF